MVKMMPARAPASSQALTLSPNGSGIHFFQMRVNTAAGQDSFAKEFSILVLAGAGGFEPPRRGIKIRLIIEQFQSAFGKIGENVPP
jgi:hypothetical protein